MLRVSLLALIFLSTTIRANNYCEESVNTGTIGKALVPFAAFMAYHMTPAKMVDGIPVLGPRTNTKTHVATALLIGAEALVLANEYPSKTFAVLASYMGPIMAFGAVLNINKALGQPITQNAVVKTGRIMMGLASFVAAPLFWVWYNKSCENHELRANIDQLLETFSADIPDELWDNPQSSTIGIAAALLPTPSQPMGPFYPVTLPPESDADLTIIDGQTALGVPVHVQGQLRSRELKPLEGAIVEVWQACQAGSYNHPGDTNRAPRDPNFQYYAKLKADKNGLYHFKTIVPGPYPNDANWMRPPHIHFRITYEDKQLVTQLYFDGKSFEDKIIAIVGGKLINGAVIDKLNELDYLLDRVDENRQSELVVPFYPSENGKDLVGIFDITMQT